MKFTVAEVALPPSRNNRSLTEDRRRASFTIVILIKVYASPLITILDGRMQIGATRCPEVFHGVLSSPSLSLSFSLSLWVRAREDWRKLVLAETRGAIGMHATAYITPVRPRYFESWPEALSDR